MNRRQQATAALSMALASMGISAAKAQDVVPGQSQAQNTAVDVGVTANPSSAAASNAALTDNSQTTNNNSNANANNLESTNNNSNAVAVDARDQSTQNLSNQSSNANSNVANGGAGGKGGAGGNAASASSAQNNNSGNSANSNANEAKGGSATVNNKTPAITAGFGFGIFTSPGELFGLDHPVLTMCDPDTHKLVMVTHRSGVLTGTATHIRAPKRDKGYMKDMGLDPKQNPKDKYMTCKLEGSPGNFPPPPPAAPQVIERTTIVHDTKVVFAAPPVTVAAQHNSKLQFHRRRPTGCKPGCPCKTETDKLEKGQARLQTDMNSMMAKMGLKPQTLSVAKPTPPIAAPTKKAAAPAPAK